MSKPTRMYGCLPRWVEWAIGLGILAFLVVILDPFPGYPRERARRTSCASNLRQIALASRAYTADHGGVFPRSVHWDRTISPYLHSDMLFDCPSDSQRDRPSYGMNPDVAGSDLAARTPEAATIAFYDGIGTMVIERHEDGANYAYLDGHAKWLADPPEDSGLFAHEEQRR